MIKRSRSDRSSSSSAGAERGVVKVIHPGRHVEVLREPVTAGDVMRKNPRHRVTRPDVFRFPWIVIDLDSVLRPGKVFYLVPERALYGLINPEQAHRASSKAQAGMTPKNQQNRRPSPVSGCETDDSDLGSSAPQPPPRGRRRRDHVAPEATALRSCLKKPDSDRRSLRLRVRFDLPCTDKEQRRRAYW